MGSEAFWIPAAIGGMQALGGALGGGQAPDQGTGYRGDLHPARLLTRGLGNIDQLGGIMAERAGQPVSLPSAFIQQPPMFQGGGLPMSIGLSGRDPALSRPALLGAPGVRFPQPEVGKEEYPERWSSTGDPQHLYRGGGESEQQGDRWLFPDAPRRIYNKEQAGLMSQLGDPNPWFSGLRQPPGLLPQAMGWAGDEASRFQGIDSMKGALEMLGVQSDELGNLTTGQRYPAFTPKPPKTQT
jgi:hypothetical protein